MSTCSSWQQKLTDIGMSPGAARAGYKSDDHQLDVAVLDCVLSIFDGKGKAGITVVKDFTVYGFVNLDEGEFGREELDLLNLYFCEIRPKWLLSQSSQLGVVLLNSPGPSFFPFFTEKFLVNCNGLENSIGLAMSACQNRRSAKELPQQTRPPTEPFTASARLEVFQRCITQEWSGLEVREVSHLK